MEQEILEKLKQNKNFRERKQKDKFLTILALRKFGAMSHQFEKGDTVEIVVTHRHENGDIKTQVKLDREDFAKVVQLERSYDRAWRKVLEEREDLRGTDYQDKEKLENDKLVELGYRTCTPEQEKEFGL